MSCSGDKHASSDCGSDTARGAGASEAKFHEFLESVGAPGALDARTKRAIGIALSVLARCDPCAKSHIKKARETGFSQDEIDEAAWMGISFGGAPCMVFYKGVKRS
jgi:AhpD family alkylhydroperoxidase